MFLTFNSLRYTKPSQLFWRAFYIIKRKYLSHKGPNHLIEIPLSEISSYLGKNLPQPVFGNKKNLFLNRAKEIKIRILNEYHLINFPIDWHPEKWSYGTHLEELNLHYMEYLESTDDKNFQKIIYDWIDNCPPYSNIYWLNSWNSFALSIRTVIWMQQLALRYNNLNNESIKIISTSIFEQILFLEKNLELDIGGNHLIKNIKSLLWAGQFFKCPDSKRWTGKGERLLKKEINEQILKDGVHYERSPSYHLQVLTDFIECYCVMEESPIRTELKGTINKMIDAAKTFTHPDNKISLFNDGGLNMSRQPQEIFDKWLEISGYESNIGDVFSISLPDAGYYGLRNKNNYFLIDCGKIAPDHLPGHGHGDILSFEWDYKGERVLTDSGVYEYHEGEMRKCSRSTSSHNTVTIDNHDQCEFWKSFRVGKRAGKIKCIPEFKNSFFSITGEHDGFKRLKGKPIHQRNLSTDSKSIYVKDVIKSGSGQNALAYLILHPKCRIERRNKDVIITRNNIKVLLETDFEVNETQGWWMPDFGKKEQTVKLVINYGKIPCVGSFKLKGED